MAIDRDQLAVALAAYELGAELGRGGWGVVFEGRHRQLGREVAIKQLARPLGADPSIRARFVAEARVLASLDHPHIVPVYDYVEADGLCLLVMEKLPGGTLWSRFAAEGLTMESSCATVLAACAGLDAAHRRGILHRDIKPENLMFSATGVLKVTDFGIAKVVGGGRTMATRTGDVLGTPSYMAPEHARGEPLGPPTDVYACGILLYELLSGQLPFSDEGDALAVLYRHVFETPVPLGDVAPHVPPSVAAVVMRSLAGHPEDRYPSAEAFGVALAEAATVAWGPGWASARTRLAIMGSPPIVSAIERSATAVPVDPPPEGSGGLRSEGDHVTVPVRPREVTVTRHAAQQAPESPELVSLYELPAVEVPVGRLRPRRMRVAALVIAGAALAAVVIALFAYGRDDGRREEVAASVSTTAETMAAEPTVSTAPQPSIYEDDFSDVASGWTQFESEKGQAAYVSGKYLLSTREPRSRVTSNTALEGAAYLPELVALGNVAVEVDAERNLPIPTEFGLLCRQHDSGEFYMGLVDSSGMARIVRVGVGGPSTLAERALAGADSTRVRRLRLECVGGSGSPLTLRLLVDGASAVEATDQKPVGAGAVGMVVISLDRAGSQVLFDNFLVRPTV